ncbi:efflux RND transporter periplasmic adaptor subunit [Brevibacillus sp. B_LB10_24]|jgi:multidrug resistance efflux pump|uniref:HlyD family secretion protein n=1 Tax=Brevibacillus sp. B_LB10_24 TaxID=3380645 RepID=UPI0038BC4ECF
MDKNRGKLLLLVMVIILVFAGTAGYYGYQNYYYVKTEDAIVTGDIYKIAPKVAGKIKRLLFDEGSQVQANQVVAEQEESTPAAGGVLEHLLIRSPISGVILQRTAKAGEVVGAGSTVALVVDKTQLYVQANVEETEARLVKEGQLVDITLDMYPGRRFQGKVIKLGEAAQSAFSLLPPVNAGGNFTKVTQRIPVKIGFFDETVDLRPGINAAVAIHVR